MADTPSSRPNPRVSIILTRLLALWLALIENRQDKFLPLCTELEVQLRVLAKELDNDRLFIAAKVFDMWFPVLAVEYELLTEGRKELQVLVEMTTAAVYAASRIV